MENNIISAVASMTGVIAFFVGITVALTQLTKTYLVTNTRYAPLFSLLFGILLAYFFVGNEVGVSLRVLVGVIIGLTASGLYAGTKTVTS